jgi:hypothetical protein
MRLVSAGGGLPKLDLSVEQVGLASSGAVASGRIRAAASVGLVQDGTLDVAGQARLAGGVLTFTARRCAELAAGRLDFGANDVRRVSGRLCPTGGPLISLGPSGWRIAGRAEGVSGEAPFLQARLANGAGPVALSSAGGDLQAHARFDQGEASDAAPQTRFRPVAVSGLAQLAGGLWTSTLMIRDGAGRPLVRVDLKHDSASGRGGADLDSGTLQFAAGGLQPAELSPLAAAIGAPAEGEARFTGAFTWSPSAQASSGVLDIPRLDFQSPAGKVSGLSGRVVFASLAPLTAAPGQRLEAASVALPLAPLAQVQTTFGLQPDALRGEAQAAIGGGLARVVELEAPLMPGQPIRGVLELDGVQLHDLVEASPFGDRVDLDAKVSGRVPFTVVGGKLRIAGGSLHAEQPGRLSIQRTALTGGVAAGAEAESPGAPAPPAPTDAFSDFAYQAMEHLAFTTLTAQVDSRPNGRLGVVFHIIGKHDPPQRQAIRLSFLDLIGKKFLNRKLPLPSGTGVDLTLDTTLNLDDLLADYASLHESHGSAQVQP